MVKTPLSSALAGLYTVLLVAVPMVPTAQPTTKRPNALDAFVGTWRLVSLERSGPGGMVDKPDCTGQFLFTADGDAAVQVMYRNGGAGDQYAQGGYEATFGRYTVDAQTHTFIFHVDGALVRTLVGKDLRRTYTFVGSQLIVEPADKGEHWRVVWTRESTGSTR
jgi:hypothetical protein